jgi:hypothetical protein
LERREDTLRVAGVLHTNMMELENDESSDEYFNWEASHLSARFWSSLPRRRWITLNSEHLGPHFSAGSLASVPGPVIERLLQPHNWTRFWEKKSTEVVGDAASCWVHRPAERRSYRGRALVASTNTNYVSFCVLLLMLLPF